MQNLRKYPHTDNTPWKAIKRNGEVLLYPRGHAKEGEKAKDFKGFEDANIFARLYGGVAVRV